MTGSLQKGPWSDGKLTTFLLFSLLWTNALTQNAHLQSAKLGVLVDLHDPVAVSETSSSKNATCGPLNIHSYQKLKAVEWAVEVINNKSWSGEFSLDVVVHDTCGESGVASSEVARLLKSYKEDSDTPLIGLIVIGSRNNERVVDRPLENLSGANISAIVTSARAAGLVLSNHPNVFTTAPDLSSVTEGAVAVVNQLGASEVAIISSNVHATRKFQRLAEPVSISTNTVLSVTDETPPTLNAIVDFLENEAKNAQSLVMFLESTELESLVADGDVQAAEKFRKLASQKSWILGTVGIDNELVKDWTSKFRVNLLMLQPRASVNSEFYSYFLDKLLGSQGRGEENEAMEYMESVYHCQSNTHEKKRPTNPLIPSCNNLTKATLLKHLHTEADIGFIVNAVSAYSAALRLAQLACSSRHENDTCTNVDISSQVLHALRNLNIPTKDVEEQSVADATTESTVATSHEIEGTQRRINFNGKLISRKYDLLLSRGNGKMSKIGQYSHEDGLVLDVMLGLQLEGGTSMHDGSEKTDANNYVGGKTGNSRRGKTAKTGVQEYVRDHDKAVNVKRIMSPPEMYISRVWAMVVTAVAITGVFISLYMLIYVLQRMCDGTLRGNQVLGVLLLLGIIMMYSSVVLFVLPPGNLLCNFKVFLPSFATTVCFGVLMLKAMQLRSLVSLGLGGRVPALNQFITLVFIVAVQLAINIQWYFGGSREGVKTMETVSGSAIKEPLMQSCSYSSQSFLYLHTYLGLLMLVVFFYGLSVLKIRRNYNEAKWITLASCMSLPIGVAWIVVVHVGPPNFQDPAACVAFIATATVLLFSIFIPKLNTISQQSKLARRKQKNGIPPAPGYGGSISTIFTTLSDRGTLQSHLSQKRNATTKQQQHQQQFGLGLGPGGGGGGYHYGTSSHNQYIPPPAPPQPPPPLMQSSSGKSVTYSPRLTTNFYHSSSSATSSGRSGSMKTPFFDSGRAAYP